MNMTLSRTKKIDDFDISVIGPRNRVRMVRAVTVNTTLKSGEWSKLSPFILGPCRLPDGRVSETMENAWQYSKVYKKHWNTAFGAPTIAWVEWSDGGFESEVANRYPMGKGAKPVGAWWKKQLLGYIEARKKIYVPLYRNTVRKTKSWTLLKQTYEACRRNGYVLQLWDYDARSHKGLTFPEVLNDPTKIMGHAFVLAMMLTHGEDFKCE